MTLRALRSIILAAAAVATLGTTGCEPDLGSPASLVTGTRFLAIRSDPAEARPGEMIALQALVVQPDGELANPSVGWAACATPKPVADNNVVSDDCVFEPTIPVSDSGPSVTAMLPSDACALFGPDTPPTLPGMPPLRPRDPDVTGGYYQPFRALLTGTPDGDLSSVVLARIRCNLANAPSDIVTGFNERYTNNVNPTIERLLVAPTGTEAMEVQPGGSVNVAPGARAVFRVRWSPDSVETYPVFDPVSRQLVDHREAIRASWFVTEGDLDHAHTGRSEDETETFTDDGWTAPAQATVVHVWVVVRDSRGGVAFAAFDVSVQG